MSPGNENRLWACVLPIQLRKMLTRHIFAKTTVAFVSSLWHWGVSDCLVSKPGLSFSGQQQQQNKKATAKIRESYLYFKNLLRAHVFLAACSAQPGKYGRFWILRGLPLCETHRGAQSYAMWCSDLTPCMYVLTPCPCVSYIIHYPFIHPVNSDWACLGPRPVLLSGDILMNKNEQDLFPDKREMWDGEPWTHAHKWKFPHWKWK